MTVQLLEVLGTLGVAMQSSPRVLGIAYPDCRAAWLCRTHRGSAEFECVSVSNSPAIREGLGRTPCAMSTDRTPLLQLHLGGLQGTPYGCPWSAQPPWVLLGSASEGSMQRLRKTYQEK